MFKEATFKNLIITEHWPSSTYSLKGSFSTSSHSLCTEYRNSMNSLLNFRNAYSQSSIIAPSDGLLSSSNSCLPTTHSNYSSRSSVFTSQRSLLDTIKEEKEK